MLPKAIGEDLIEVAVKDFKQYDTFENGLCFRFWHRYRVHNTKTWDKMTPQQLAVIELFDALLPKLEGPRSTPSQS